MTTRQPTRGHLADPVWKKGQGHHLTCRICDEVVVGDGSFNEPWRHKGRNEVLVARAAARTCDCGHLITYHQTGEGAWTGFCYASADCKCERPTTTGAAR